jgi:CRISPR-associated endonuclease/helicase Cas3
MSLSIADFVAFHLAVHGRPPFDWQDRLLRKVHAERRWPRVLDLPTGSGKTTCIDISLFALALDASRPGGEPWCPRRVAMVVDRRVVVDQVAERGRRILAVLTTSAAPVVVAVRDALISLAGAGEDPLAVYTLRGGIPKDNGWARTPRQPLVLASTVDQLGSRLLVQGYGVTAGMRPIHAGLLANDTLLLLDEVHLSRPFADTLDALSDLRASKRTGVARLPNRFHHVFLSATPGDVSTDVFSLDPHERQPSAPLGRRLHAPKPARLEKVKTREDLVTTCTSLAAAVLERHRIVAVVVNRVATARQIAADLRRDKSGKADVALLTGRMRPLDRDDVLSTFRCRIVTGRDRNEAGRGLVVVGTQCIEAGADFDFDALISESASLDALRQRFGRVDRLGEYVKSESLIVHVEDDAKDDPIYGAAKVNTWKWIEGQRNKKTKAVDFGIEALVLPSNLGDLVAPKKSAPALLPAYLDLWMQTSPEPAVVPDTALFLHGPASGPADVQIIWRCDLRETDLSRPDPTANEAAAEIVGAVKPSSLEAVSVPFTAARAWLRGSGHGEIVDVDNVAGVEGRERVEQEEGRWRALRWRGADSQVIGWRDLRPGDTIVVPSERGGMSHSTFDPNSPDPVTDLAERASLLSRGRAVLRLHPTVLGNLGFAEVEDADDLREAARAALEREAVGWKRAWLMGLTGNVRRSVVGDRRKEAAWVVLEGDRFNASRLRDLLSEQPEATVEDGADATTDDEDSFHSGRAGITLAQHSGDVEGYARRYAQGLGLPGGVASDLALAGWLHDIGKADPRFQLLLRGGDEVELYKDERPWAKSVMRPSDRRAQAIARSRSKYPRGARHEVQSLAMIDAARSVIAQKANDLDLVLHLVASHHGYCRPFAPPALDREPVSVELMAHESSAFGVVDFTMTSSDHRLYRLDSPLADRFWGLVERYGWLELCWLESILRLADHRASEAEEANPSRGAGA